MIKCKVPLLCSILGVLNVEVDGDTKEDTAPSDPHKTEQPEPPAPPSLPAPADGLANHADGNA